MLMPKRVKYRKVHRLGFKGRAKGGRTVVFGDFGLQATTSGRVTARQIEAARVTISRKLKKVGEMWVRVFPDQPITKKPAETRMGKGKGNVDHWVAIVKRGKVMFEVKGVSRDFAKKTLLAAAYKLPVRTRFVERGSEEE